MFSIRNRLLHRTVTVFAGSGGDVGRTILKHIVLGRAIYRKYAGSPAVAFAVVFVGTKYIITRYKYRIAVVAVTQVSPRTYVHELYFRRTFSTVEAPRDSWWSDDRFRPSFGKCNSSRENLGLVRVFEHIDQQRFSIFDFYTRMFLFTRHRPRRTTVSSKTVLP